MTRTARWASTAAAVLVLTACAPSSGDATPSPDPTPGTTPTAMPTATATASPTQHTTTPTPPARPTPTPTTPHAEPQVTGEIGGALGSIPEGFRLPEEDAAATEDMSAYTTTVWRAACPDRILTLASASAITGSRIKEASGPEHTLGNGLLVFSDDAAADAFVTELLDQLNSCDMQGPEEEGWRTVQVASELVEPGDLGVQIRTWTEWNADGTWIEAPGASLQDVARQGRYVALTWEGGEYSGDPANLPEVVADASARITDMLDQLPG